MSWPNFTEQLLALNNLVFNHRNVCSSYHQLQDLGFFLPLPGTRDPARSDDLVRDQYAPEHPWYGTIGDVPPACNDTADTAATRNPSAARWRNYTTRVALNKGGGPRRLSHPLIISPDALPRMRPRLFNRDPR